jgi:hypothetical protein
VSSEALTLPSERMIALFPLFRPTTCHFRHPCSHIGAAGPLEYLVHKASSRWAGVHGFMRFESRGGARVPDGEKCWRQWRKMRACFNSQFREALLNPPFQRLSIDLTHSRHPNREWHRSLGAHLWGPNGRSHFRPLGETNSEFIWSIVW